MTTETTEVVDSVESEETSTRAPSQSVSIVDMAKLFKNLSDELNRPPNRREFHEALIEGGFITPDTDYQNTSTRISNFQNKLKELTGSKPQFTDLARGRAATSYADDEEAMELFNSIV